MHPIFQSFKRTYWSSMRFSRAWMAVYTYEYRITPARFDMLIAIAQDPAGIAQAKLRSTLDVCGPVVTVMLDSLEELGYVERHRVVEGTSGNHVIFTKLGRAIFEEIVAELLRDGFTEHMVRRVLALDPSNDARTLRLLARTRRFLTFLRARVLDRSTLVYPCYLVDGNRSPAHPYRRRDHVLRSWRWRRRRDEPASAATP